MADAASLQQIDQVVREYSQAGMMFTAYDVTVEARRRGANIKHDEARDRVHQLFQQGSMGAAYTRTAIDVGAPTKPLCYHPFHADPTQYQAGGTAAPKPTTSPQQQPGIIGRMMSAIFGQGSTTNSPAINPSPTKPPANRPPLPRPTTPPISPRQINRPRQPTTLGLDAGQFLPISRDELKDKASKINLWGSPWFGRRDLIPPVDDQRTLLIDRALVANGLLSPEQLTEIHRVGAEMDRVRPDVLAARHQATQAGSQAVAVEREARAKLKAEKKAAAAKKKAERIAAIAARRANDITFLGRGVSARLGKRDSDIVKLTALGLPLLATPTDVAHALELTIGQLRWLAFHTEVASRTHYIQFTIPKRSGGVRTLSAPHRKLAAAQTWILRSILDKLPTENSAHGFIVGRSILTNAREHVGKEVLINMDLESFFPSITLPRVRSVFERCGYSPAVATILALLCTEAPRKQVQYAGQTYFVATGPRGLPQGACTSPALSNQVARRLDKRLLGIATKMNLHYTRYADDVTFSGDEDLRPRIGYVMARIRHIAEDEGFVVNESKNRVLRRNSSQQVTGLVVNDRPGVPRKEMRRLRAILHAARKQGLAAQNREGRSNFSAWLLGMISFVGMSQPELGQKMRAELNAILQQEAGGS